MNLYIKKWRHDRQHEFRNIIFNGQPHNVKPLLKVSKLVLPKGVILCGLCLGHGQLVQHWCDAPPGPGACDMCKGGQFVYDTAKPIPRAVHEEIERANPQLIIYNGVWTAYRVRIDYGGRLFHRQHLR